MNGTGASPATHPAEGRAEPAEIVTIEDAVAAMIGTFDRHDIATVGPITHRGFTLVLPDGHLRVQLSHGPHVPIRAHDPVPSDQHPFLPSSGAVAYSPGFHEIVTGD